jgi:O-antigen ligase
VDPNIFGGMLALCAALVLPQVVARRPLVDRRLAALLGGAMALALLATVSRGSLLGFAAALVLIGLVRDRRLLAAAALGGLGLLVLARYLPWTAAYVEHFGAAFLGADEADRATQMRIGEYRDAVALIRRYPLFGVGFGDVRDVDLYRGVSSLYLLMAETMGLVGLGAFLALVAAFFGRIALAWRSMPADGLRAVVLGCLAGLAAVLVSGAVDHYFFSYPHAFALLWLVLGLAMSAIRIAAEESAADLSSG